MANIIYGNSFRFYRPDFENFATVLMDGTDSRIISSGGHLQLTVKHGENTKNELCPSKIHQPIINSINNW